LTCQLPSLRLPNAAKLAISRGFQTVAASETTRCTWCLPEPTRGPTILRPMVATTLPSRSPFLPGGAQYRSPLRETFRFAAACQVCTTTRTPLAYAPTPLRPEQFSQVPL